MQHRRRVANLPKVKECVAVKLPHHVLVNLLQEGFVEKLYCYDDILHRRYCVLCLNLLERSVRVTETIGIAPGWIGSFVAAVIESILRLWRAV